MNKLLDYLVNVTDKLGKSYRNIFKTTKDIYIDHLNDTCNKYFEKIDNDKEFIYKLQNVIADLQVKYNTLKMENLILKQHNEDLETNINE